MARLGVIGIGATQSGARKRRVVRSLFLGVITVLVAQLVYAYAVQEPYPSFVFPSFAGAPDEPGTVRIVRPTLVVRFTNPDRVIETEYQDLLEPASGVVSDAIAYTVLAPPSSNPRPRSVSGQFRLFLEQPSFERGASTPSAELRDPRTLAWLRTRLSEMYPGQAASFLEIRWDEHRYALDDTAVRETVTTRARVRVSLEA